MRRFLICLLAVLAAGTVAGAQSLRVKDFESAVDSLKTLLDARTGVSPRTLRLEHIRQKGSSADFYFSVELGDYPLRPGDDAWIKKTFHGITRELRHGVQIRDIYAKRVNISELTIPAIGNDGSPVPNRFRMAAPSNIPLVRGRDHYSKGLSGRHIALWQSHGLYWNQETGLWSWQRPANHRTLEDLYTQSYVLPFLIPMLENAGAVTMTPRERDIQTMEAVCDNDPAFERTADTPAFVRIQGQYAEKGKWQDAGEGFADALEAYRNTENPFTMGSARMAKTDSGAQASWSANLPESGDYAVYVSYKSLPESITDAHYTVEHSGGSSIFRVNQRMGGGTWIYLGTFHFDRKARVTLSSQSGMKGLVTADAVRFGGGYGKTDRGGGISGMPAFVEGALSSMQYGGFPLELTDKWEDNYTKDYAGRGAWVQEMTSRGIPFDLSLAFHTDAGLTPNDSIIGTLAIYTYKADNSYTYADGQSRMNGRMLSDFVQSQVVSDIRAGFEPEWTRRQIWDRSYSESRTTGVPGLLLELLSHQNFADMRYGLDPSFRFAACRAVYKGILKYISARYGVPYVVQPLPVHSLKAVLREGGEAILSWEDTPDSLEPTAVTSRYRVYTRIDDGPWDQGTDLLTRQYRVKTEPGRIYSFRVEAMNDGGKSFPSEVLSVGRPRGESRKVVIVNNFTRVAAPTWFDSPEYAGFTDALDGGMPLGQEINFAGEVVQFRRDAEWTTNSNPGFGGTLIENAGKIKAGNSFDYVYIHGKAALEAGYAFESTSAEAWDGSRGDNFAADIICGKQVRTRIGRGAVPDRYAVFPEGMQKALREFTGRGGNLIVSGAYIATDAWDYIYPGVGPDSLSTRNFIEEVLGYKWITNFGDKSGKLESVEGSPIGEISYNRDPDAPLYMVEFPDGIAPAGKEDITLLRYSRTKISAAVLHYGAGYRTVSFGFPIEVTDNPSRILKEALQSLTSSQAVQSQEVPLKL